MGYRESRWSAEVPAAFEIPGYRASALVERASAVMGLVSREGALLYVNRTGRQVLGVEEFEPERVLLSNLVFGKSEREILSRVTSVGEWRGEIAFRHQGSGAAIPMEAAFCALAEGGIRSEPAIALEARLTGDGSAEEEPRPRDALLRAAKMEAVARLAGGMSGQFEDLLTAISGFSEVLLDRLEPKDALRPAAERTLNACHRTAALIHQLVAVGRRQALEPAVTSSNDKVREMQRLLGGVLGEDIVIETELSSDPAFVRADPAQLEQVLLHLMVNGRDAMPEGGKLTIRTERMDLDEVPLTFPGARGSHVRISVTDTGHGMDTEELAMLFEPFFTSKKNGAGLGLATVYGIVSQSGGHLEVDSRPGAGATFAVYLPAADDPR
jgi:signal transduction histidine kinase